MSNKYLGIAEKMVKFHRSVEKFMSERNQEI